MRLADKDLRGKLIAGHHTDLPYRARCHRTSTPKFYAAMIQKLDRIVDTGRYHEPAARDPLYARLAALKSGGNEHESK